MGVKYTNFDLNKCISTIGLDERGKAQEFVAHEILKLSEDYIPFDEGTLRDSGHVENGTDVVWGGSSALYAPYQWNGIVYEDPLLHCAGFQVADGGWRSRKGVKKVPTNRKLSYQNGNLRGAKWVDRMLQNGGLQRIQEGVRRIVSK